MRRRLLLATLLGLLAVPSPAAAATHYVNVKQVVWDPADITVRTGDTVTWSFGNALDEHTLNSSNDKSDWDQILQEDKTCAASRQDVSRAFLKEGEFLYQCNLHPDTMTGTIKVSDTAKTSDSGASTEARLAENLAECPAPGLPLMPPPPTTPTPPAPGAVAPLVNDTPAPVAPAPRTRVSAPAAIRRVGVRALSSGVRVRFSLARRGTVSVRIRSSRTRKVVKRATLRRLKAGVNSVRVPVRRLARGRYTVEVAARGTVVRKRLAVR